MLTEDEQNTRKKEGVTVWRATESLIQVQSQSSANNLNLKFQGIGNSKEGEEVEGKAANKTNRASLNRGS